MKILVIEDNQRLAERIGYHFKKEYTVDIYTNGIEAIENYKEHTYSVIILDLGLPDMTGGEVCKHIRSRDDETPLIILTGNNAVSKRVELLNAGADDFLSKPFDVSELKARVNALRRRGTQLKIKPRIIYKDIEIDTEQHTVKRSNQEITLRRKEFEILQCLIQNKGRVMTREMIMHHVWSAGSSSWLNTVDVHIKHLRDKIDKPFESQYIKTSYGLGYKIEA